MRNWNYKAIQPYIWLMVGLLLLSGLSYLIYSSVLNHANVPTQVDAAQSIEATAKVFHAAESYHVLDEYKTRNSQLPLHSFGTIQIAKPKVAKGVQAILKKGRILNSYVSPDGERIVYFVQRIEQQEPHAWIQIDMVSLMPETQQIIQEPISYVYGDQLEAVATSTLLGGFISNEEFLYTTVANMDQEWVYLVNRFQLKQRKVTPVLELFRYEPLPGENMKRQPPLLYNAVLAPDKKHLLIRDSLSGITSYTLDTGAKNWTISGSNEIRAGELFDVFGDSGMALYGANRFQSDPWLIDVQAGFKRQPFTAEKGLIEAGIDAKQKVIYYNFTNDRAPANVLTGPSRSLLLSQGVQLTDLQGTALRRFTLPDSKERLEFGGYSDSKKIVLLHKYTAATNKDGQLYKKTTGWLLGDMSSGAMTPLKRTDVPDGWDKADVLFGKVSIEPYSPAGEEQAFINMGDNTYYLSYWKTRQVIQQPEDDTILFADEQSKRIFMSSFTRPDLVVAASNFKKYNGENQSFRLLKGNWISRNQSQPEGDKITLFQMN